MFFFQKNKRNERIDDQFQRIYGTKQKKKYIFNEIAWMHSFLFPSKSIFTNSRIRMWSCVCCVCCTCVCVCVAWIQTICLEKYCFQTVKRQSNEELGLFVTWREFRGRQRIILYNNTSFGSKVEFQCRARNLLFFF